VKGHAGLQLGPFSRIHRLPSELMSEAAGALVYLATMMEYLAAKQC